MMETRWQTAFEGSRLFDALVKEETASRTHARADALADHLNAMAAAIADQAKVSAEQAAVIADLTAKLAAQGEALAVLSKTQAAAMAAGFDGLKAVLMAPVELSIDKNGTKRARRVVK